MNILIIGKDYSIFRSGTDVQEDGRRRHARYARLLAQRCGPDSSIRMICYSPRGADYRHQTVETGFEIFPTRSRHRMTFLWDAWRLLPRVLRDWKPDLITAQTPWEEGFLGHFLARRLNARFLVQLHFDLLSEYWLREHWSNPMRARLTTWLMRRADGVRVVSAGLAEGLAARCGVERDRIHVAPVGTNFAPVSDFGEKDTWKARLDPDLAGKPVVLFVGHFYAPKDIDTWIQTAARIADELPEARFVMAGDGPQFADVQTSIAEHGLADRFHLLGAVGHGRLPEIYAAADVFLLSSRHESFGRVIVEAHLSGVPVVATETTGSRDLVNDGKDGFIRPVGESESLAQAVLELLLDPEKAGSFGTAGRARARTEFSADALALRVVEGFQLVGSSR